MKHFKDAKEQKKKTYFRAEDGEYVLYIENKKVTASQLALSLFTYPQSSHFTIMISIYNYNKNNF